MKMELTECSETSAHNNHPKERIKGEKRWSDKDDGDDIVKGEVQLRRSSL